MGLGTPEDATVDCPENGRCRTCLKEFKRIRNKHPDVEFVTNKAPAKSRKAELEEALSSLQSKRSSLTSEMSVLEEELKEIKDAEVAEENIEFIKDIDVFLKYVKHTLTACSDDDRRVGRCVRCTLLEAKDCRWLDTSLRVVISIENRH